jgi:pimeloyl-ACP methyl ester carboxylesterase
MMTAEGWLSTWSGLSTRVNMHADVRKVTQPVLSINFQRDVTILPFVAEGVYDHAASADKTLARIDADHFAFRDEGERDAGIGEVAAVIVDWLRQRFAPAP